MLEQEFRVTGASMLLLLLLMMTCVWRNARSEVAAAEDDPVLVRPLHVYEGLIKGVHDYFNNTCIILFHGSANSLEEEGLEEMDRLLALQRYLSGTLSVRTSIMDFRMFKNRVGKSYHRIKRPLFVLLNDFDPIKEQFAMVSKWVAMASPAWLVFLRDGTRFEEFLANVYVPFDCVLMVAQRDSEGDGETVRDVYRISKGDDLRWMKFAAWDSTRGFQGPRLGLYQRRHDLQGRNLRVVSLDDPPVSRILRDESSQPVGIGGFFGEVIQLLQQGMNCTSVHVRGGGLVGRAAGERHVDGFDEDVDGGAGGSGGNRDDNDVRQAERGEIHYSRLLDKMPRVHQEAGHDGGEMERVLGTVRVERLERDSADDRDHGPGGRRHSRVLLEIRLASARLRARCVQPVRDSVPRVWRVLRARDGAVSAGYDSAGAAERSLDRGGGAGRVLGSADQLLGHRDVRDAFYHDGGPAGGRHVSIRGGGQFGRLQLLSEHQRCCADGDVRGAAGHRDRSARQLPARAAPSLSAEQVRVYDAGQHGLGAARAGGVRARASGRGDADDDRHGCASREPLSRNHRQQHSSAARQRNSSAAAEDRMVDQRG